MTTDLPVTRSCADCQHEAVAPWNGAPAHCIDTLDRLRNRRRVDEGEALFCQGYANAGLHCISEGVFGISITHENGTEVMMSLAYPGDTLGARAFLRGAPHQTTAVALTGATVCTIRRRDALKLTQDAPGVHLELVKRCLREMDRAHARIVEQACLSNRARLCRLLAELLAHQGEREGARHVARLPISRGTMAGMLGIQPESLSRIFSRLKAEGLIEISGRHVAARSLAALEAEASVGTAGAMFVAKTNNRHGEGASSRV